MEASPFSCWEVWRINFIDYQNIKMIEDKEAMIKKCILLVLFCFPFLLSACTQGTEDTQEHAGTISNNKAIGYEYTITKEQNSFSWKIGYKGDMATIQESMDNKDELQNFMMAVNDSKAIVIELILLLSYFLIVALLSFFLYKKNRRTFLNGGAIVVVVTGSIALYIAFYASFDLSNALQDAKFHYLRLTN
ncbi:MAG: hypothetical protein ABF649_18445 [Bacillus sp. (in: firmicutes)]